MADYTQLEDAIIAAHEAGDTEAAKVLASELNARKSAIPRKKESSSMQSFLRGVKDPIDAGAQLLSKGAEKLGVADGVNSVNNWIAENTGLMSKVPAGGLDELIRKDEANYQSGRGNGFDGYRLAGNVLSPMNLALASKLPMAGTLAQKTAQGALGGAALGVATQPVYNGDFAEQKGKQALYGAIGGAALPSVASGVARLVSPKASTNPNIATLKDAGVTPTIGQTLGGRANVVEEKLASWPIVGDAIAGARNRANAQFEKATFDKVLSPIGQKLPTGLKGNEAVAHTENVLKQSYDDVLTRIGAIKVDGQYQSKINNLESMVNALKMPKDKKMEFNAVLNNIKESTDNGYMTSQAYKDLESNLGSVYSALGRSSNVFDNRIAPAIKQVQQELRDMLSRNAGDAAKDLSKVNSAWASFKRVQNAAAKVGADEGSFTPSQLLSSVKAMDKSKNKAAFARGDALLQDFASAGKNVLGNRVPNSGTADRLLLGSGAAAYFEPTVGASLLAGGLSYTNPAQKAITSLLTKRPDIAPLLAEQIKNQSRYLLPLSGVSYLPK